MPRTVAITLYASECGRNDYYLERIRVSADAVGLSYTLRHVSSPEEIEAQGLRMPCLFSYCPGCRQLSEQEAFFEPGVRCTPALEVDGQLISWNYPAEDAFLKDYFQLLLQEGNEGRKEAIRH